jgi:hypothetical protein
MFSAKKALSTAAVAIVIGAGGLIVTAGTASARVICNAEGDCWHTDTPPPVVPGVTFSVHPDDWYFHQTWGPDRHFREYHDGRGYWRGGVWVTL